MRPRAARDPAPDSPSFNDTARFLAGLDIRPSSPLATAASTKEYRDYCLMIDRSWKGPLLSNLKKISAWRIANIPPDYHRSVFYPFSGPDVLHPLAFYPDAEDITMFGLEPTGGVPVTAGVPAVKLLRDLACLPPVINFTLDHAFFITRDMLKKVGKNDLCGITAVMMFFLARDGFEVVNAREIYLDADSKLTFRKPVNDRHPVRGVEILFRRPGDTTPRRARYFQLDVSDKSPGLRRFLDYCAAGRPYTTIIKSASYIMFDGSFSKIRSAVLENSDSILQDDSGVPYRLLKSGPWDLTYFGKYHKPIGVFHYHFQKDLQADCERNSRGPLPFVYGYGFREKNMTYHLVLARKSIDRKGVPRR